MNNRILVMALLASIIAVPALGHASFGDDKKSVNYTAFTLSAGEMEIGMTGSRIGITDQLQVGLSLMAITSSAVDLNLAYQIDLGDIASH